VLLRLAYLTMTNTFTMLRLLPVSDQDKDAEILALRHQIAVLERQLGSSSRQKDPVLALLVPLKVYLSSCVTPVCQGGRRSPTQTRSPA
jgi:hypothetical protein